MSPLPSRRTLLQAGTLACLHLTLADVLRARAQTPAALSQVRRPVRGVILANLTGGLSHIDSLDPKPNAPKEIRGTFNTIATAVPGVRLTEPLPRLARCLGEWALVRSMRTLTPVHEPAAHRLLAGVDQTPPGTGNTASRRDRPHLGALLARARPDRTGVPTTVVLPHRLRSYPGQNGGFLGGQYDPWFVTGDPSAANYRPADLTLPANLSVGRLHDRAALLAALDRQDRGPVPRARRPPPPGHRHFDSEPLPRRFRPVARGAAVARPLRPEPDGAGLAAGPPSGGSGRTAGAGEHGHAGGVGHAQR